MHQLKEKGIFMVAQDQERIPISHDNNSGTNRDNANTFDDNSERIGKKTGFIQRERVVSGAGFAQAVVFSFMAEPESTRQDVNQTAATAGMTLSTQGLDKRFTAKAAYLLDSLLAEAVQQMIYAEPRNRSILSRFNGVYVSDSTVVSLPEALARMFQGNNGETDAAAKVAVQWDLNSGGLGLWLSDGTVHDQRTGPMAIAATLPEGALRLNDLGFFNLTTFAEDIDQGRYFLSRYKTGTLVYEETGVELDLANALRRHRQSVRDLPIQLGQKRLPCRLIALPVSPQQLGKRRQRLREIARKRHQPTSQRSLALADWTLYVTNIPSELLTPHEAAILAGTRWQIECLFKLWKSDGQLASSRSQNPQRVLCEFYAKLLACLIQHWITLVGCWQHLDRSLYLATQVIRKRAFCLLEVLNDTCALILALQRTAQIITDTCRLSKRATHPLTFQRWIEVACV
jgi:hypothetical protein